MRKFALALVMLLLAVGAACSDDPGALPKVPDFKPAGTTTTDVDYSDTPLRGVGGRGPATTVALGPGAATVSGTVEADDGLVPGATVQIERVTGGSSAGATVQTLPDGTWSLPQILGGRYRVRAWRAPDLAQTQWTALFLGASESKTVSLKLRRVGGLSVEASIAPDPPYVFEDTNLVALVTVKTVDEQGVVRATPQENVSVTLVTGSGWRILSSNPTSTNGRGEAEWSIRCRSTGHNPLQVEVGTVTVPISVSSCEESTPETTTTTAEVGIVPE